MQVRELAFKHCETLVDSLLGSCGAPSLLSYPSLASTLTPTLSLALALALSRRALALLADEAASRRDGPPALAE